MTGPRFPERATSRAVLIGAGTFRDPELPDIPAVQANLDALRRTLTDPVHGALAPEHCLVVADPKDQATVGTALSQAVREAEDLLLVYYCGHGLLDEAGMLHFALTGTDNQNVSWSAIHLDLVKRMVGGARAKARVLVLDCCFAGKAISAMAGPSGLTLGQLNLTGTYTLTSTTATAPSHAPPDAAHTSFTGSMLQALTVPGPLTLDEVHHHIDQELAGLGLPRPQRRSVGAVGRLSLVRGPAREPEAPSTPDAQTSTGADNSSTATPASIRRKWAWRTVPAVAVLSAMAVLGNQLWGGPHASPSLFSGDSVRVGLETNTDKSLFPIPAWGRFSAFAMETVKGVLEEANIKSRPTRVEVPMLDRLSSVERHEVDLNAALTITSERMEHVEFVGPVASDVLGILVRGEDMAQIRTIADLKGKTVCMPAGSTAKETIASVTSEPIRMLEESDFPSCIEALKGGRADATTGGILPLSAFTLENVELAVVPGLEIGSRSQYGIALPKGYGKDCTRLRDALVKYVESGKWKEEFRFWLSHSSQPAERLQPDTAEIARLSCRG
ncbi:transporter substrate-binding domain-containing protein [Kitasatospora sp. NPDC058115]|uniref:caspase, EACC1-associated type n=1 Tax=Kitasatospora sp. NPDC058115 TaxID=3346347 RepID=UPI0036DAAB05